MTPARSSSCLLVLALAAACGDGNGGDTNGGAGGTGAGTAGASGATAASGNGGSSGSPGGGTAGSAIGGSGSGGGGSGGGAGEGMSGAGVGGAGAGSGAGAGMGGNPVFTPGPSCTGLESRCGPAQENCCLSIPVPGGSYDRSNDPTYPASISGFRLDKYEVSVGRFRRFVEGYPANAPASGAGKNPNNPTDPGFVHVEFLPTTTQLFDRLDCDGGTWRDSLGSTESYPITCVNWYTAFAFCIWDGGRLATEAEWNYAAAGGSEQRPYPWSTSADDESISAQHAVYSPEEVAAVGSRSPLGDGRWGHADLAGNVSEWLQDYEDGYLLPCSDCANRSQEGGVLRGGNFQQGPAELRTEVRDSLPAPEYAFNIGFRCARPL